MRRKSEKRLESREYSRGKNARCKMTFVKINADVLFVGAFLISACPWFIAMFHVFKFARFQSDKPYGELRGFNPLRWRKVRVKAPPNVAADFANAQCRRWIKICSAIWLLIFVLLGLLLFGLDALGWLVQDASARAMPVVK